MLTDVKYNPMPDYYTSIKHSKVPLIQTVPNLQYLTFRHGDRDKAVEIHLTEDELQSLYEMPLTGKNDHIRDVFLIGCYTCQRVSDYNNLNADNFETTRKGTRIIRLVQQKTKTEVTILILNENQIGRAHV